MLYACDQRFDVTGNLENFCELNKALGGGALGSGDDATKDRDLDVGVVTPTCRMGWCCLLGGHDEDLTMMGTDGSQE